MKYTELKDSIKDGAQKIYLLEGEDAYFRLNGEEMIKKAFLEMPELNYTVFEGENLKGSALSELVAAVKNYPFMAEKRIIKVTDLYPSESEFETYLKPLFDDFPPTSVLIIVNVGGKRGVDLKRKKAVTFVDCSKAEPETVARWVYITLKRAGIVCSVASSENIAAYCLYNMSRVSVEVQKLIDYKGQGELTQAEIDELVYKDADYRIYEMTNAVARRDFTKYCAVSADLRSKGFDEISVLNGLFSYFRNLLSALSSPLSDGKYAAENGMKEYAVKKTREQASQIGANNLKNYVNLFYKSIADVKCGVITPLSALQICENTLFFSGK